MKGDRKNRKRSKKYSITRFLSSFKLAYIFSCYGKLVMIGLVFSLFLIGVTYLYKSIEIKDINIIAYSNSQEEYYKRLEEVRNEYNQESKDFSELVITSTFTIMQSNIAGFSYDDMSKDRMREIADLMLKSVENNDGSISYSSKTEEEVKESLTDYFKDIDSSLEDVTCQRMAEDVYDYVEDYLEFIGANEEEETPSSPACDGNSYWWPIGSAETTTEGGVTFASGDPVYSEITAYFGGDDTVHNGNHGAIDISNNNGVGGTNIIASKDGVVIYPTNDSQTGYADNGYVGNEDGGGYGNYVVIEHSDGNYTYYAHMAQNSITVRAGDSVKQGQVIGKMGHSGSSTATHLHFEMRSSTSRKWSI